MGGAVGNPADVVNVRMQNDGSIPLAQRRHYRNAIDGLVRIVREEGATTLARGLGPNVNRAILMTTSQLVSYDVFKDLLVKRAGWGENVGTHFGASLLAVSFSFTITFHFWGHWVNMAILEKWESDSPIEARACKSRRIMKSDQHIVTASLQAYSLSLLIPLSY